MHLNIEIKAHCSAPDKIHELLKEHNAIYKGLDHQVDTYFNLEAGKGRLKLREGNIENSLIHYHRNNQAGPKKSEVTLYHTKPSSPLKQVLTDSLGTLVIVDKKRHIYFIENVKFHLDVVKGLGSFVEIEAIDKEGTIGEGRLKEQCEFYLSLFGVEPQDLVDVSYSDLLMRKEI